MTDEQLQHATAIARELGALAPPSAPGARARADVWRVNGAPQNHNTAYLLNETDASQLYLSWEPYGARGRLVIRGSLPEGLTHQDMPYNATLGEISVSVNRPAVEVAREITRRLLPDYLATIAQCRIRKAANDAEETRRDNLMQAIGASLEDQAKAHRTGRTFYVGAVSGTLYGDIEVRGGEVKFDLHVKDESAAIFLAAALREVLSR